ncbi:MAG: hypothetical protein LUH22_18730 [Bacteroides sp.]|nr:hypothetical protein [Bacteroides sp.]
MLTDSLYPIDTTDLYLLVDQLQAVQIMPEIDVCNLFNTDSVEDISEVILDEIDHAPDEDEEEWDDDYDPEEDRMAICRSVGLSRWA